MHETNVNAQAQFNQWVAVNTTAAPSTLDCNWPGKTKFCWCCRPRG